MNGPGVPPQPAIGWTAIQIAFCDCVGQSTLKVAIQVGEHRSEFEIVPRITDGEGKAEG